MARHDTSIDIEARDRSGPAFASAQRNLQNLASSAAILEGPLGAVAGRINSVGAALGRTNPLTIAGTVAVAGLTVAVVSGTKAYGEYEQQMFRINAQLKATESISGQTAAGIDDMSKALGRNTLASQQGARRASAALLRFTNVQNRFFERTLKAGQDASAVFGGDLQANVLKIARAIDNPTRNLEQLERQLVTVTKEWKENVIAMGEAGDSAGVAEAILDELARTMGGAGEGEAQGMVGAIDSASEAWTDLILALEQSDAVSATFRELTDLLDDMAVVARQFNPSKELELVQLEANLADVNKQLAAGSTNLGKFLAVLEPGDPGQLASDIQARIAFLEHQISTERDLAAVEAERGQAAQQREAQITRIAKAEDELTKAILTRDAIDQAVLARRIRDNEKLKRSAEAVWLSALPPIEKLEAEYKKDVEALDAAFDVKKFSFDRFKQGVLNLQSNLADDKAAVGRKDTKVTSRADQVREQLLGEEDQLEASYIRRALIVSDATARIGDDEVTKLIELQNTIQLLTIEHEQNLAAIRIGQALIVTDALNQATDLASDYYFDKSRRTTQAVNSDFQEQADSINDSVKKGVISRKQGDAQLAALEDQRQAQLEVTARKQFERGKKLARQTAIAQAGAVVVGAMADTHGDVYTRIAAGVSAGLVAAAQVTRINTTQYEGGGSVSAGGGGAAPPPVQQVAQAGPGVNNSITIIGDSSTSFSLASVVELIGSINTVSDQLDLTVISPSSRNASDIRDSTNNLVIG